MRLRLLYVVPYFAPAWAYGGPPRVVYNLCRSLSERRHEIRVFTTDALDGRGRVAARSDRVAGAEVRYFRNVSNALAWHQKVFVPVGFESAMRDAIHQVDALHLFDLRTYLNAVAFRSALRAGTPYLLSAHGQLPLGEGLKRPIKRLYDLLFGRRMLRGAAVAVAQTENERMAYRQFGVEGPRIELVPLPVDLAEFRTLPPRGLFRSSVSAGASDRIVLFLGRINEYKGLDLLVEAVAMLREKGSDLKLAIVGRDDGYLERLRALVATRRLEGAFLLSGPLYGADRLKAYVDADLFVVPSAFAEETPLAALEACACGTPVVVTRGASIPWLEEYGAGEVSEAAPGALSAAIERVLDRREAGEPLGGRARALIEERFEVGRVAGQLESLYRSAIRERAGGGVGSR